MNILGLKRKLLWPLGIDVVRIRRKEERFPNDFTDSEISIINRVRPFTMTGPARLYALIQSVRYLIKAQTPGAFVECGVWKGGSMMAVALTLLELGVTDRMLYLFDTFEGMPEPTDYDVRYDGVRARDISSRPRVKAAASLEGVKQAMESTGYPLSQIDFIKGRVEETVPGNAPQRIALLRLDTDWYESTKHELAYLYPYLSSGGVLILDDYGWWQGARRAVDEYFKDQPILLNRIDSSGRIAIKIP